MTSTDSVRQGEEQLSPTGRRPIIICEGNKNFETGLARAGAG